MITYQPRLFGAEKPTEYTPRLSLDEIVGEAIELLREHAPEEGYYLAFSGGKDSVVCKRLLEMSGVRFDAWYNQTTIDPPELVRFIQQQHDDVAWNRPRYGNMMTRVATAPKVPPTRKGRWCCQEYKENGGRGCTKVFGLRAAESRKRAKRWNLVTTDMHNDPAICPIVFWSDDQVWDFIHAYDIPYCSLYDEGWSRLGCVGCPLATPTNQAREFERWPRFEANWRRAIIRNWEKWHDIPNTKTGLPRHQAKFRNGDDYWHWWLDARLPDYLAPDCQPSMLWTNEGQ